MTLYASDGADRYSYENGVLQNKFNITDAGVLEGKEADLTYFRMQELLSHPLPGNFDLDHLKAIHHHLFQDVYEWAGEIRTVQISKESTPFAQAQFIESEAEKLFSELAQEKGQFKTYDKQQFCKRMAYYLGEINMLHPFREGNGRTQRIFCSAFAAEIGKEIDWTKMSKQEMIDASKDAVRCNYDKMTALFEKAVVEPRSMRR